MLANDGEGPGNYVYRTQWDLTGFDLSTVQITGGWTSDNVGLALRVNGTATGITNTGNFGSLNTFVINLTNAPTLTAGVNTIDFVVNNADPVAGFTGLRVNISSAIGLIPPNTSPHIAVQPTGGNALHNGTFTLAVGARGSAPLINGIEEWTLSLERRGQPLCSIISLQQLLLPLLATIKSRSATGSLPL